MLAKALAVVVSLGALAGCGPIEYVNEVTRRASRDVASAKSAKAEKYAPYHYTLSVEYLHKAREEAAHADYQAANRFGRRSSAAARKAKELALDRSTRNEVPGPFPDQGGDGAEPVPDPGEGDGDAGESGK